VELVWAHLYTGVDVDRIELFFLKPVLLVSENSAFRLLFLIAIVLASRRGK
jgi:hypothetical protein